MNAAGVEGGGVEQGSKDQGGNDQRSGGGAGDRMRGGQVGRMSARMRGVGKSGKGKEKEVYGFVDGGTETLESFRMASGEWDERYFNGSSNGSAPPGGYQGRKGIYEFIEIDDQLRTLIHNDAGEHELEAHARTLSESIRQDGRRLILDGETSLEEVFRVTRED